MLPWRVQYPGFTLSTDQLGSMHAVTSSKANYVLEKSLGGRASTSSCREVRECSVHHPCQAAQEPVTPAPEGLTPLASEGACTEVYIHPKPGHAFILIIKEEK